jgi:hypothetical protein
MINMPVFPYRLTPVTARLEFCRKGEKVHYYFDGTLVFSHHVRDVNTLHMITAQLCILRHAKVDEIVRAFGLEAEGVELAMELFSCMGVDGFYPKIGPYATPVRAPAGAKRLKSKIEKLL